LLQSPEQTYFFCIKTSKITYFYEVEFSGSDDFSQKNLENFRILDDVLLFRNQPNAISDILQWANGDRQVYISNINNNIPMNKLYVL
jgi:hypothetical protein